MPNFIQAHPSASSQHLTGRDGIDASPQSTTFTHRRLALATRLRDCKTIKECKAALAEAASAISPATLSWALTHQQIAEPILAGIRYACNASDHATTLKALALTCSVLKQVTRLDQTCLRSTGENLTAAIASAPNIKTLIIDGHCTAEQIKAITGARQLETLIAIGLGQSFIDAFSRDGNTPPSRLALRNLNLSFSDMLDIPADLLANIPALNSLALVGCGNLMTLPDQLPPDIQRLDLRHCTQLQTLPEVTQWRSMELVDLRHCPSLQRLPRELQNRLTDQRSLTVNNPSGFAESIETGPIRIPPRLAPPALTTIEAYLHQLARISTSLGSPNTIN